jgi:hypothetical protein
MVMGSPPAGMIGLGETPVLMVRGSLAETGRAKSGFWSREAGFAGLSLSGIAYLKEEC